MGAGRNASLPSHNFGLRAKLNFFEHELPLSEAHAATFVDFESFSSSLTSVMASNIWILLQKVIEFQTEPLVIDVGMNVLHSLQAMWSVF